MFKFVFLEQQNAKNTYFEPIFFQDVENNWNFRFFLKNSKHRILTSKQNFPNKIGREKLLKARLWSFKSINCTFATFTEKTDQWIDKIYAKLVQALQAVFEISMNHVKLYAICTQIRACFRKMQISEGLDDWACLIIQALWNCILHSACSFWKR